MVHLLLSNSRYPQETVRVVKESWGHARLVHRSYTNERVDWASADLRRWSLRLWPLARACRGAGTAFTDCYVFFSLCETVRVVRAAWGGAPEVHRSRLRYQDDRCDASCQDVPSWHPGTARWYDVDSHFRDSRDLTILQSRLCLLHFLHSYTSKNLSDQPIWFFCVFEITKNVSWNRFRRSKNQV